MGGSTNTPGPASLKEGPDPASRLLVLTRLEAIEARISKLDAPRTENSVKDPWWRKGTFVVLLGSLATVGIPIATAVGGAISGILESQRMMLQLEHDIVREHLNAVLTQPIGEEGHLRRIRFMERFRADQDTDVGAFEGMFSSGLTWKLGEWAKNEHDAYSAFLERETQEISERIIDAEIEHSRRTRRLATAEKLQLEWAVDPDRNHVQRHAKPELVKIEKRIEDQISQLRDAKDDSEEAAQTLRDRWAKLRLAYEADNRTPSVSPSEDFFEDLVKRCDLSNVIFDEFKCLAMAEEAYERTISGQSSEVHHYTEISTETYNRLCERDVARACSMVGKLHRLGHLKANGDEKTRMAKAADYYQKACDAGDPDGCNGLGWRHYNINGGRDHNPERARELFERACNFGDWNGCDSLGTYYVETASQTAKGKDQDDLIARAKRAYSDACSRREMRGCVNLLNLIAGRQINHYRRP